MKFSTLLLLPLLILTSCSTDFDIKSVKSGILAQSNPKNPAISIPTTDNKSNNRRVMVRDTGLNDLFPTLPLNQYDSIFGYNQEFIADGFDFPVNPPNAQGYFKAQEFGDDQHLGEDWNAVSGGNTDLGDPVYAVANGLVTYSKNVCCGWGNVVRIVHRLPNRQDLDYVESVYAHLHHISVQPGQLVRRGEKIGSIGNAEGRYMAHLHLEMRDFINMSLGPGYSNDVFGFLRPTEFIRKNRPKG